MTEAIIALSIASLVLLGSPGPATMSLAAVGATAGFAKGSRYLAGILLGLLFAMAGAMFGVATIFTQWPQARWAIQILGATYIFYIAYRIATADVLIEDTEPRDAPGFRDGFILNLLNAKAYMAMFVLFSQFLLPFSSTLGRYAITALVSFAIIIVVDSAWLLLGSAIRPIFSRPKSARLLRVFFALTIIIATLWALLR